MRPEPPEHFRLAEVEGSPMYGILISFKDYRFELFYENVGQLPDVHATVMHTDLAVEINLATIGAVARSLPA